MRFCLYPLSEKDLEVLEYQAVATLEALYIGPMDLGDIHNKESRDNYLSVPSDLFDSFKEAEEVKLAVKHLREAFGIGE